MPPLLGYARRYNPYTLETPLYVGIDLLPKEAIATGVASRSTLDCLPTHGISKTSVESKAFRNDSSNRGFAFEGIAKAFQDAADTLPSANALGKRKAVTDFPTLAKKTKVEGDEKPVSSHWFNAGRHILEVNFRDAPLAADLAKWKKEFQAFEGKLRAILEKRPDISSQTFPLKIDARAIGKYDGQATLIYESSNGPIGIAELNDSWTSTFADELIRIAGRQVDRRIGKFEDFIRISAQMQLSPGPSPHSKPKHDAERHYHLILTFELAFSATLLNSIETPSEISELIRVLGFLTKGEDGPTETRNSDWFYKTIRQAPSSSLGEILRPAGLRSTLMPFQSDSVCWLLEREGKQVAKEKIDGHHVSAPLAPDTLSQVSQNPFFKKFSIPNENRDNDDRNFYFSWVLDRLSTEDVPFPPDCGLLLHEMGLGKTVHILALILMGLEPERLRLPAYYCEEQQIDVQPTGLTLILCPLSILAQWETEIQKHAPSLRCYVYPGIKKLDKSKGGDKITAKHVGQNFDIVLCSFDIMSAEVLYARAPPDRKLRRASGPPPKKARRSLLIEIEFLRVCRFSGADFAGAHKSGMDEVQMAHNTAGAIAETASYIKRKYAFASSGTPLRTEIQDLRGLLYFLGYQDVCRPHAFTRLLHSDGTLKALLDKLAIRATKRSVAGEIDIPKQERYIVPLEFGPIENVAYKSLSSIVLQLIFSKESDQYLDAITALGLDQNGNASTFKWRPEMSELMRWMTRLRHVCCHSSMGAAATNGTVNSQSQSKEDRKRLKIPAKNKAPKTLTEVLAQMRSGNASAMFTGMRAQYAAQIRRAHFTSRDRENCEGLEEAISLLREALAGIQETTAMVKEEIKQMQNSKGSNQNSEDEEDDDMDGSNLGSDGSNSERKIGSNRLRDLSVLTHTVLFYQGNIYNTMGTRKDDEDEAYQLAEQLRREILKVEEAEANAAILKMTNSANLSKVKKDDLVVAPSDESPGLKTVTIFYQIDQAVRQLNRMAELLWRWRQELSEKLATKLVSEVTDNSLEDYENDAVRQEELDVLHDAYEMLLADWKHGLTGERIDRGQESGSAAVAAIRQKLLEDALAGQYQGLGGRNNYRKNKSAKKAMDLAMSESDTPGIKYYKKLAAAKEEVQQHEIVNLRASLRQLRDISTSAIRQEEIEIASKESLRLRGILSTRDKAYDALHKELHDILTPAFNARGQYFAALQKLSDAVTDVDITQTKTKCFLREIEASRGEEIRQMQAVAKVRAKKKYLDFLHQNMAMLRDDERICSICSDDFKTGVFTSCGHLFCSSCLGKWFNRSQTCPVCKSALRRSDLQKVTFDAAGAEEVTSIIGNKIEVEPINDDVALSYMDEKTLADIQSLPDVGADLGIKIDTIIKHIRSLRRDDPAAKVVLFSAWQAALDVCAMSFDAKGIKYVRLENSRGGNGNSKASRNNKASAATNFANDPEIAVFILHTQSQAAGLNLTAAQTVILIEPLLHPSIELQAVGRVHRIGQNVQTKVFQYVIKSTVDERLAQLNARNGHPLFLADRFELDPDTVQDAMDVAKSTRDNKNAEEALLDEWSLEDVSRVVLETHEQATLQDCLIRTAEAIARGEIDEDLNTIHSDSDRGINDVDEDGTSTEADEVDNMVIDDSS